MYHVEVTNHGDSVFTAASKDAVITVDTKGKGITPPDALLASLGSCVGVYLRKYADGAKIPLGAFLVTVDGELSHDAPVCFRQIRVTIDLKGIALDERRKKSLLDFLKNCPIHNTLKNDPDIALTIR